MEEASMSGLRHHIDWPASASWQSLVEAWEQAPEVASHTSVQRTSCTGSGKTYTLAGDLESSTDQGLLTRSVNHLALGISEITDGSQFQVCFLIMSKLQGGSPIVCVLQNAT